MTERTVVNLWCGPRTGSTALMYSFRQRADTAVFDEPFYGRYLRHTDPGHPGRDVVIAATPADYEACLDPVLAAGGPPVRFIKNIAHHLDALPPSILDRFANGLLVRDPERVVASLGVVLDGSVALDITGFAHLERILDHELAAGRRPVVIESGRLLAEPERALTRLCESFGLPFDPAMLTWPAGPKPEDGPWAQHWYGAVHRSTGFAPPPTEPVHLDAAQQALADRCRPIYERLLDHHLEM
ncbi:MAG: sulfotransferase family protein [Actinomycetota bacterium]